MSCYTPNERSLKMQPFGVEKTKIHLFVLQGWHFVVITNKKSKLRKILNWQPYFYQYGPKQELQDA